MRIKRKKWSTWKTKAGQVAETMLQCSQRKVVATLVHQPKNLNHKFYLKKQIQLDPPWWELTKEERDELFQGQFAKDLQQRIYLIWKQMGILPFKGRYAPDLVWLPLYIEKEPA